MIECCGDLSLWAAKKFDGDFKKALNYLCEVERDDDEWGVNYLEANDIYADDCVDVEDLSDDEYNKYVAENITFAR